MEDVVVERRENVHGGYEHLKERKGLRKCKTGFS